MPSELLQPFISVCVPAYKRADFLIRLLDSLVIQTFTDFEVIVSDDSPDNSVHDLTTLYSDRLRIIYNRNLHALGTPANWNQAIKMAGGQWIKLIHDDDWLASDSSLQSFVDAILLNPGATFFFSAYSNVRADKVDVYSNASMTADNKIIKPEPFRLLQLKRNPVTLLSKNVIGPPSVVIHKNDQKHWYDPKLQWLVDMDFYMRYLNGINAIYIDKPLVNIGLSEQQVTRSSSLVRQIEVPEHFRVLEKTGVQHLRNLLIYDAWWRLIRNLKITDLKEIAESGYSGVVPLAIVNLIRFQKKFSEKLLAFGPASKILMACSYFQNRIAKTFK